MLIAPPALLTARVRACLSNKRLTDQLRKYTEWLFGKTLFHQAVAAPGSLHLSRQERTILFADIRGFTHWSERHAPEEAVARVRTPIEMDSEHPEILPLPWVNPVIADRLEAVVRETPGRFDAVVVDPPAFIKRRRDHKAGMAAYQRANQLAMRLLPRDGLSDEPGQDGAALLAPERVTLAPDELPVVGVLPDGVQLLLHLRFGDLLAVDGGGRRGQRRTT